MKLKQLKFNDKIVKGTLWLVGHSFGIYTERGYIGVMDGGIYTQLLPENGNVRSEITQFFTKSEQK